MKTPDTRFVEELYSLRSEQAVFPLLTEWNRRFLGARYASGQTYNKHSQHLSLVAHCAFAPELIADFNDIPITCGTICARAARFQQPIFVPDVVVDKAWTPFLGFSEAAGFTAVLSIPLILKDHQLVGVTSCHFDKDARLSKKDINIARLYSQLAADAIDELRLQNGAH